MDNSAQLDIIPLDGTGTALARSPIFPCRLMEQKRWLKLEKSSHEQQENSLNDLQYLVITIAILKK